MQELVTGVNVVTTVQNYLHAKLYAVITNIIMKTVKCHAMIS